MAFRLRFKEPPAAASGKTYETLDDRCWACVIQGGTENPCQSEAVLGEIEKNTGRPCPRVELEAGGADAFALLGFLIHEDLKPLAPKMFDAITYSMDPEERADTLRLVQSAMGEKKLLDILHPDPKKGSEGRR